MWGTQQTKWIDIPLLFLSCFFASCRLAAPFAKSKCPLFCRWCKGTLVFVHALCYCRRAEMPTASHECSFSELMNSATCQQSTGMMISRSSASSCQRRQRTKQPLVRKKGKLLTKHSKLLLSEGKACLPHRFAPL